MIEIFINGIILALFLATKHNKPYLNMVSSTGIVIFVLLKKGLAVLIKTDFYRDDKWLKIFNGNQNF